jgi:Kdo2-lipid IVA lauroyltransferase/acyltransferase
MPQESFISKVPGTSLAQRLGYLLEAAGFFMLMGLFRLLGIDLASAAGGLLGRAVFYRISLTKRARQSHRRVSGEKPGRD